MFLAFRAVCKHWNSCALPVYPADSTPILISNTISDSGLIRCYSPYLNKMFIVRTPLRAPESRIFSAAANGWIVLRRPDKTVMFGSLLDGSAFETTESKYNDGERWKYFGGLLDDDDSSDDSDSDFDYDSGSDSASDLDSDSDCNSDSDSNSNSQSDTDNDEEDDDEEEEEENLEQKVEEEEDEEDNVVNEYREFTMSCNPVLHKGLWYCLGEDGSLGVYDPNRINWHVLCEPSSFGPEFPYQNCYLVDSNQELLAVLTGRNGTPIHVLKLKEKEMTWERMDSLGSRAIFTGTLASLSMAKPPKAMANKVYLPKFYWRPQIIQSKLTASGGRLFFVPEQKEMQDPSSNKSVYTFMREYDTCGDKDGTWCYDLELDSGVDGGISGCKNMLQYIWVHLGLTSP